MKNLKKNAMAVALGTAGAIGSKVVKNKIVPMIPGIGSNEYAKGVAPIALGLFLMNNKNQMLQDLGLGMAISAAGDLVAAKVPGIGDITGEDMNGVVNDVILGLDDQVNDILSDDVSDDMSDDVSDDILSDDVSDDMSDELGDDMSDDVSDDMSDELGDDMSDELGDDYSN
jgi:hypothetical protein